MMCPNCGSGECPTLNRKCVACGTYLDGPAEIRTYDPKDVKVTFNGVEITGFMDGAFIGVDPAAPDSDRTAHLRAEARGGTCRFTLLQEGQSNLFGAVCDEVQTRQWTLSINELLKRWARKDRRRARMARKKRRGWA
jgi:hypothetical protein